MTLIGKCRNQNCRDDVADLPSKVSLRRLASLDHSMWFHAPFKADEWMLCEFESPAASGARALSFGRLYRQDGALAVTCAQEGLVRLRSDIHY